MNKKAIQEYCNLFEKDLFEAVIPFWYNYGIDHKNGGIESCLTREGVVYSAEKSVWMQGRAGWMFAYICNELIDDPKYRELAKQGLDFARKYCIDKKDGRMYFIVSSDGTPIRKRRYTGSEKVYVRGNAEYYGLTKDKLYLDEARKYYDLMMRIVENPNNDPYKITPKFEPGHPPTRNLCSQFVLLSMAASMEKNDKERALEYQKVQKEMFDSIIKYGYVEQVGTLLENVGLNGEYYNTLSSDRTVLPGHCFEAIWTLLDYAEDKGILEKNIDKIEQFYDGAWRYGWDKEYGGILYFLDADGFPPQAYEHDMKLWWVHTEAVVASLKLYRLTGKQKYWNDFEKVWQYCYEHFRDAEYGEWYGYLRRDGKATEPVCKGNIFKGPLHVPRMYAICILEFRKLLSEFEDK